MVEKRMPILSPSFMRIPKNQKPHDAVPSKMGHHGAKLPGDYRSHVNAAANLPNSQA
jgi:hypothetical protein